MSVRRTRSQIWASLLAFVAICLGLATRVMGGGWLLIPLFIPYILFALFGIAVLVLAIVNRKTAVVRTLLAGLASFLAYAFQTDYGDGGPVWFAVSAIWQDDAIDRTPVPSWWITQGMGTFFELVLFIPAACLFISILYPCVLCTDGQSQRRHGPKLKAGSDAKRSSSTKR